MKNGRELLFLGVLPTDKCNRGCAHCLTCATSNGNNFVRAMWIRKLVIEAKELKYRIKGSLSGLGEPLMHPKIAKLAQAFVGLKVCTGIDITTSGFLAKDLEEKKRFLKLINHHSLRRSLHLNFSFNLYSPTFPERLQETLSAYFCRKVRTYCDISVVADCKNFYQTFAEMAEAFCCMEVKTGMHTTPLRYDHQNKAFKLLINSFLSQEYTEKNEMHLYGNSLFMPYIYSIESKKYGKKYFRIDPQMTIPEGRAEKFSKEYFRTENYCCENILFAREKVPSLFLGPDGRVFPGCKCVFSDLHIGTWKTPLSVLLARKKMLQEKLLSLVLSDMQMKWGENPCEQCAALVKRNFCFDY